MTTGSTSELNDFLSYLIAEKAVSLNTSEAYRRDLEEFLAFATRKEWVLETSSLSELREYLALMRRKGLSPRTMARKVAAIRSFFKFLMRENRVSSDPSELLNVTVKKQTLPKFLTVDQMFRLIDAVDSSNEAGIRDRALLELWYATGARVTEMTTLTGDSVDFKQATVRIIGKGNRERMIPVSPQAVEWCKLYKDVRHAWLSRLGLGDSPYFFLTRQGKCFTRQGMWKLVRHYAKKAGLPKVWPHLIRHSFATHVLEGGADLRAVQELLGHRSIATTEVYTHLDIENLKQMQLKYHPRG